MGEIFPVPHLEPPVPFRKGLLGIGVGDGCTEVHLARI